MPYQPSSKLAQFLKQLPKTETHLHIEGALPFELIQKKFPQKYGRVPHSWSDDFKFRDFAHFESELLGMAFDWYASPEAYKEASTIIFHRLFEEQNVRYIETSFASGMIEFFGLDGPAVARAIKEAAHPEQEVVVFMGIHHNGYTEKSKHFLEECHQWDALSGIDLHGTESVPIEEWTLPFWQQSREQGLLLKAHAGEFCGADFIEWVIDNLGVRRIQHGVRVVEDERILNRLKNENIILDVCPISNVKLDVVSTMEAHPIRQLFDAGITCTINTDDPLSFGNQLHEEYAALHQVHEFTFAELAELAKNGFRTSKLSSEKIKSYMVEIDELVEKF